MVGSLGRAKTDGHPVSRGLRVWLDRVVAEVLAGLPGANPLRRRSGLARRGWRESQVPDRDLSTLVAVPLRGRRAYRWFPWLMGHVDATGSLVGGTTWVGLCAPRARPTRPPVLGEVAVLLIGRHCEPSESCGVAEANGGYRKGRGVRSQAA
jgi:hypothetical protein